MTTEDNKALVRRYRALYNANDLDALGEVLAADFKPHSLMPGLPPGLESYKQVHQLTLASFPDYQVTTDALIAEGDRVVEVWTQTMTHTGQPIFGAPANSGRKVSTWGINVFRIADGRIAEHWGEMDFIAVLMQLGVMPAPQ